MTPQEDWGNGSTQSTKGGMFEEENMTQDDTSCTVNPLQLGEDDQPMGIPRPKLRKHQPWFKPKNYQMEELKKNNTKTVFKIAGAQPQTQLKTIWNIHNFNFKVTHPVSSAVWPFLAAASPAKRMVCLVIPCLKKKTFWKMDTCPFLEDLLYNWSFWALFSTNRPLWKSCQFWEASKRNMTRTRCPKYLDGWCQAGIPAGWNQTSTGTFWLPSGSKSPGPRASRGLSLAETVRPKGRYTSSCPEKANVQLLRCPILLQSLRLREFWGWLGLRSLEIQKSSKIIQKSSKSQQNLMKKNSGGLTQPLLELEGFHHGAINGQHRLLISRSAG